jgi:predicted homoserine dehydrogenase-like protein
MIIVDKALLERERQGKFIRVGMIGAGFMGQGLTNQIVNSVPGMRMSAVYNRRPERASMSTSIRGARMWRSPARRSLTRQSGGQAYRVGRSFAICRSSEIDIVVT